LFFFEFWVVCDDGIFLFVPFSYIVDLSLKITYLWDQIPPFCTLLFLPLEYFLDYSANESQSAMTYSAFLLELAPLSLAPSCNPFFPSSLFFFLPFLSFESG